MHSVQHYGKNDKSVCGHLLSTHHFIQVVFVLKRCLTQKSGVTATKKTLNTIVIVSAKWDERSDNEVANDTQKRWKKHICCIKPKYFQNCSVFCLSALAKQSFALFCKERQSNLSKLLCNNETFSFDGCAGCASFLQHTFHFFGTLQENLKTGRAPLFLVCNEYMKTV